MFGYIDSGKEGRVAVAELDELDYSVFEQMIKLLSEYDREEFRDTEETGNADELSESLKDELWFHSLLQWHKR